MCEVLGETMTLTLTLTLALNLNLNQVLGETMAKELSALHDKYKPSEVFVSIEMQCPIGFRVRVRVSVRLRVFSSTEMLAVIIFACCLKLIFHPEYSPSPSLNPRRNPNPYPNPNKRCES